ncbi:GDSL esterase/lipase [Rhynchospora pubera]|uniref:GDSL esterase/lipase n=1 Tax=Rhynchospora pubera TaxID=906938 RepID=A0AAV8C9I5_9POAL|nr:GDSL esterase/lipase [Rhynchospora pubera]
MVSAGKTVEYANSKVPVVVSSITSAARSLLDQGVQHMVLPGVVPLGCLPRILTVYVSPNGSDYDSIGCLQRYNDISQNHNRILQDAVKQLQIEFPKAVISYADYYQPITEFLAKPTLYGVAACPDPTTVNWDGIAFTEKAYNIIANGWRNGLYAIPPI